VPDILRLYWGPIVGFVIFLVAVLMTWMIARRHLNDWNITQAQEMKVRKYRNTVLIIITVIFALGILNSLSVNRMDRSTIDRSDVKKQQQDFENRHQKPDTNNTTQGGSH